MVREKIMKFIKVNKTFLSIVSVITAILIVISIIVFIFLAKKDAGVKDYGKGLLINDFTNEITNRTDNNPNLTVDFGLVEENSGFKLYYNPQTAEIAVYDKSNDKLWRSNPASRENEKIAVGSNLGLVNSQVAVTYFDNNQEKTIDSYTEGVKFKQFFAKSIENGIAVTYKLGRNKITKDNLPQAIPKTKFEKLILPNIKSESARQLVQKYFKFTTIKNNSDSDKLKQTYKNIRITDLYILDRFTPEMFYNEIMNALLSTGYTPDDIASDNKATGIKLNPLVVPSFVITIQYKLDKTGLTAEVDSSKIYSTKEYPAYSIRLLEFFGAASQNDKGYIVLPDGSGSIINFDNNGNKDYTGIIKTQVYGKDLTLREVKMTKKVQKSALPVFGIKNSDSSFLGIVENGDFYCNISGSPSGISSSYNTAFAEFTVRPKDEMVIRNPSFGETDLSTNVYQKYQYDGKCTVRYKFLYNEKSNYASMAVFYRNYLIEKNELPEILKNDKMPFYAEILGSYDTTEAVMGLPRNVVKALTTTQETREIFDNLKDAGIDNIILKYNGWFNEGILHKIPVNINIDSVVGSRKEFMQLNDYIKKSGGEFFPDVSFMFVNREGNGFNLKKDTARLTYGDLAIIYPFSMAQEYINYAGRKKYVTAMSVLPNYVSEFMKSYKKLKIDGVSLRDITDNLDSDFNETSFYGRDKVLSIIVNQLKSLNDEKISILGNNSNKYAFKYINHVLNIPMIDSGYTVTNYPVPFLQMVLHGHIGFTGEALNSSADREMKFLKTVESGGGIYSVLSYKDSSELKNTDFNSYYATNYKNQIDYLKTIYNDASKYLNGTYDKEIINHEKLLENVYKTTYSNGSYTIVNYNDYDVDIEGTAVKSKGFVFKD